MKMILSLVCVLFAMNVQAKSVEIMSYNVENLFDAKHDEGKNDWSFLPKDAPGKKEACAKEKSKYRRNECYDADWTDEKVEMKLAQITDVITKERKGLPDFLGLVEVENGEVVGRLAKKLGYDNVEITTSPDFRGVDVALLYKTSDSIKKISRAEHNVPVDYPSRNILEVEFSVDGHPLTIFVNHWPSLANPDSWRIKAAEVLATRTKEILAKNPKMAILAMGDFNTIDSNDPHPFKTVLFKDNLFTDAVVAFKEDKAVSDEAKKKLPEGSYYFPPKDQWNYLDHIFYTSELKDGTAGLKLDLPSFEVYLPSFALKELKRKAGSDDEKNHVIKMVPNRFNTEAKSRADMGFSDHFAVVVKLNYPDPAPAKVEAKKAKPAKNKKKK
ncbi:endonuclease/exonuclease/phosphatase family protein [Bacteriovorax sp. PP10]|uniref:Endonuclease/exonuclease/phosphatase family protein n=1 Tax=Bacteriovorax antarcticus TaxID=3088717 RepID=A0ABU5VRC6_9BACT|nr:endonuclease/exonuclease/phosphatase family protein [Bacteriovorax sp. PP10]MEA9355601.1 endonuclease/exonuclease/phosphatase family protein [Bacteriovorax sp. PP10]